MNIKHYSFLLLFTLLLSSYSIYSQNVSPVIEKEFNPNFCGTDFFHNQKMNTDPQYKARHLRTIQSIKKVGSSKAALINGIYQVPVVVHVMHKGESEGSGTNISNEDVKRGIEYLNNYWRKVDGSNGFGDGVDMKIEFALAVQDENGDCTDGIDRVDMSSVSAYVNNGVNRSQSGGITDYDSSGGVNSLKEYSIWDPTKYYNVWIVDEIDNKNCSSGGFFTAGYATYATSHGEAYDGSVVLICTYLNESSTVWAHEMGHAFNLPHTFDGDDSDFDGEVDQCGEDNIFDTPSHKRTSSIDPSIYNDCNNNDSNDCDLSFNEDINPDDGFIRNSGTHQDHMHNYMDYTGCPTEFTGGQRAVVTDALTVARASYLLSPALTPPSPATVYFSSSATNTCLGSAVTFTDQSSCTPNTYTNNGYDDVTFLWTIDNGVDTPYASTDQSPIITFSNSGTYDVKLEITNPEGTTSLTKEDNIFVSSGALAGCSVTSNNHSNNFGTGVTSVLFNTLNNTTSTTIPANPVIQDFTCSNNTTVNIGTPYDLDVVYSSINGDSEYLEVWIDWDNNGSFETSNSNGDNENVLNENVPANSAGSHTASGTVTPPADATLNNLLRMRVISNYGSAPNECGNGSVQRADDYGVLVKPACTPPTAGITNNSGVTVLTCAEPSISLTATGGVSYQWDNNMGITSDISITEPGTYVLTATSLDGCTDSETIIITENKPLPTPIITNNTGSTGLTCSITSINVTASGGDSYSWDNGLGNNATAIITTAGTYTVTVTSANSCANTTSIVVTDEQATPGCIITSSNSGGNYTLGVTNVSFNTINKATGTYIPPSAMQNFICSDNTTLIAGSSYDLNVDYKTSTTNTGAVYLEVWIDWDDSGSFESSNGNGVNEQVLSDNIAAGETGSPSVSVEPEATAVLNKVLRMRVISEYLSAPDKCGGGLVQRADDYGVTVTSALSLTNFSDVNSGFRIYPNPVKDLLTISLENKGAIKGYEIYDITGKKVLYKSKTDKNLINTQGFPSGFYFLKVKTDNRDFIGKFIKE